MSYFANKTRCQNLIKRRLSGKKNINRDEYNDLISEAERMDMTKQEIDLCLKLNGVEIAPVFRFGNNSCDNLVNKKLNGRTRIEKEEYQMLVAEGETMDMTQQQIDECLAKNNVRIVPVKFCNNLVNKRLNGKRSITSKEYNSLILEARDLDMNKEQIDECLNYNQVKLEASQEFCNNLITIRLKGRTRIEKEEYNELLEDLPNIGMIKIELDNCLNSRNVKVMPVKFCDNLVNKSLKGNTKITSHEYNMLISDAKNIGMTKEEIDECLKDKNVQFEAPKQYCDNLVKKLGKVFKITTEQYNELLEDLPNIGMMKQELDKCLFNKDISIVDAFPQLPIALPYSEHQNQQVAKAKYLKYKAKYIALKNKLNNN
jgi:hypothetical protein